MNIKRMVNHIISWLFASWFVSVISFVTMLCLLYFVFDVYKESAYFWTCALWCNLAKEGGFEIRNLVENYTKNVLYMIVSYKTLLCRLLLYFYTKYCSFKIHKIQLFDILNKHFIAKYFIFIWLKSLYDSITRELRYITHIWECCTLKIDFSLLIFLW